MGNLIEVEASDGHTLSAYRADPRHEPKAGVVVIQEIFGVNAHIRSVCDGYANDGYLAIAPAVFDRQQRGVELGYDDAGMQSGIKLAMALDRKALMLDVAAAVQLAGAAGKVGVVGYCFGGTVAWSAAGRLDGVACAAGFYGGNIVQQIDLKPRVPTILHFGEHDSMIPLEGVEQLRQAHPGVPIHLYPAGHGFNCDARDSYDPDSAALARQRTLQLFDTHLSA